MVGTYKYQVPTYNKQRILLAINSIKHQLTETKDESLNTDQNKIQAVLLKIYELHGCIAFKKDNNVCRNVLFHSYLPSEYNNHIIKKAENLPEVQKVIEEEEAIQKQLRLELEGLRSESLKGVSQINSEL